jgi:hypothetical protein
LAQDLGRSLEAGVSRTVRIKPSEIGFLFLQQRNHITFRRTAHVSEWVAHRRGSNSSSTTRPLGPTVLPTLLARGDEMIDRQAGFYRRWYFKFSMNCQYSAICLATKENGLAGIPKNIFAGNTP